VERGDGCYIVLCCAVWYIIVVIITMMEVEVEVDEFESGGAWLE
jgi:hypothetical protein